MPNQTPEPPRVTDGQIAEWERDLKLARKPSAADECVYARDEIFTVAMPRLLAEVKRLQAENETAGRTESALRSNIEMLRRRLDASLYGASEEDSRAPRTTERL